VTDYTITPHSDIISPTLDHQVLAEKILDHYKVQFCRIDPVLWSVDVDYCGRKISLIKDMDVAFLKTQLDEALNNLKLAYDSSTAEREIERECTGDTGEHIIQTVTRNVLFMRYSIARRLKAEEKEGVERIKIKPFIEFNGIRIDFNPLEDNLDVELVKRYHELIDARRRTYEESDEYKARQKKDAEEVIQIQADLDKLVEELPGVLESADKVQILTWVKDFSWLSDRSGVNTRWEQVVKLFNESSFQANVNTGKDYNGEDLENVLRYLVGQFLDFMENTIHCAHQIVPITIERALKEKFNQ